MFDQATADKVCDLIAAGKSLREIETDTSVSRQRVLRQVAKDASFADQYSRAMELRTHALVDGFVDLREQLLAGKITPDQARVAADLIKWPASKLLAKVYGDRVEIDVVSINITDAIERRQAQLIEQPVPLLPAP